MVLYYYCEICGKKSVQKSASDNHIEREKHKMNCEIFRLKLDKFSMDYLKEKYTQYKFENKIDLLNAIVKGKEAMPMNTQNNEPEPEIPQELNITNREALKEKIHEIHNFLRNNGAGYGMNALKVFNIFYGLKKIEENNLFDKVGDLDEEFPLLFNDVDWFYRFRKLNGTCIYLPNAKAFHIHGMSVNKNSFFKVYQSTNSLFRYFKKNIDLGIIKKMVLVILCFYTFIVRLILSYMIKIKIYIL